jgi:hypothetical protein
MGKLESETGLYIESSQLIDFLAKRLNSTRSMTKVEWELFAGAVLSQFLYPHNNESVLIGVPIEPNENPLDSSVGFTLFDILTRPNLRRDQDVDINIRAGGTPFKFQIARVVSEDVGYGRKTFEEVLSRKILKQSADSKLFLAIMIEENTTIAENQLINALNSSSPYGGVFLIGKMNQNPGEFHCRIVYPKQKVLPPITVPIRI